MPVVNPQDQVEQNSFVTPSDCPHLIQAVSEEDSMDYKEAQGPGSLRQCVPS